MELLLVTGQHPIQPDYVSFLRHEQVSGRMFIGVSAYTFATKTLSAPSDVLIRKMSDVRSNVSGTHQKRT